MQAEVENSYGATECLELGMNRGRVVLKIEEMGTLGMVIFQNFFKKQRNLNLQAGDPNTVDQNDSSGIQVFDKYFNNFCTLALTIKKSAASLGTSTDILDL